MNTVYTMVWSESKAMWVPAPEITRRKGKQSRRASGRRDLRALTLTAGLALGIPNLAFADPSVTQLPTGGSVVAGAATITQNNAAMVINQSSNRAAIDWQSFNVGRDASVHFNQPNATSATLNRVLDSNPSQIFGQITAPGQVFLSNPNGVYFSPSASVDVGALTATTHRIGLDDFMSGNLNFERDGATGSVINEGTLEAALGGYIALLAPEVRNEGFVIAQAGAVVMAAGEQINLQFSDGHLAGVTVSKSDIDAIVENKHAVLAPEGLIILSAQAASNLRGGVVNNEGSIEAGGITRDGGRIYLEASDRIAHSGAIDADGSATGDGGVVILMADLKNADSVTTVSGSITAQGGEFGGDGGFVETSGSILGIQAGSLVSISAEHGQSGLWLLDPTDVTIDSGTGAVGQTSVGVSVIEAALASGNVTIDATNDITVAAALSNNTANNSTLTLTADSDSDGSGDINVNAVITIGAGDGIALNYGSSGYLTMARDDATNTFTGKINLDSTSNVSINGSTYTVINTMSALDDLQGNTNRSTNYVLGSDFSIADAVTDTLGYDNQGGYPGGWKSLFNDATGFKGKFEGFGHIISDLTVNKGWNDPNVGLFARLNGAHLSNFGLTNVSLNGAITGAVGSIAGDTNSLGGLVTLHNLFSVGDINPTNPWDSTGGLIGSSGNIKITQSYFKGNIHSSSTISSGTTYVGGLCGACENTTILNSYSTGSVKGYTYVGGLIGAAFNDLYILKSYSTSNVNATKTSSLSPAGGLIGSIIANIASTIEIDQTYASGDVRGATAGGLIGNITNGGGAGTGVVITNSYASGDITGQGAGDFYDIASGFIGYTTDTIMSISDSYSRSSSITSAQSKNGFINILGGTVTINNSYFDNTILTGMADNASYGQSTTFLQTLSNLSSDWDIATDNSTIWKLADGYPCLTNLSASCSIPVSYTLSNVTSGYTYNGSSQLPSEWNSTSIFGGSYNGWVLGTDYYISSGGSDVVGFTNAATYSSLTVNVTKSGFAETSSGSTSGSFVISPKTVTLSGEKTYDGDNTLTGSEVTIATGIGSETLTFSSATANDTDVTTENKYISAITLGDASDGSGGLASNYQLPTLNVANAPVTINAKSLTISGITASNKIYDGDTTSTIDVSSASYTGLVSGDSVSVAATGIFSDKNVGTGKTVTLTSSYSGDDTGNYSITDQSSTTANITAKPLSITASVFGKTYDGTTDAIVMTSGLSGFVDDERVSASATGAFDSANAGSRTATISFTLADGDNGGKASNYSLADTTKTATISPKTVALSASKVYDGGTDLTGDVTIATGVTGTDGTNPETLTYSGATSNAATVAGGAYVDSITLVDGSNGGLATNYQLPSLASASAGVNTATISAKTLTVTGVASVSTTYGTSASTGGVTLSGVLNADDVSATAAVFLPQYTTSGNLKAGSWSQYVSSLSGDDAGNYSISGGSFLQPNNYVVNQLPIAGSMASSSTIYGESLSFGDVTFSNVISGDDVSVDITALGTSQAIADSASANSAGKFDVGTYTSRLGSLWGADSGNYSRDDGTNYFITGAHEITAKPLNISGLAANKTYDGSATATLTGTAALIGGATSAADGLYYTGDTVGVAGTATGLFADQNAGSGKAVTISGLSLTGAEAGNYTLNAITTATISPKTVALSASKVYDGGTDLTGDVTIATGVTGTDGTNPETLTYSGATSNAATVAGGAYVDSITLVDGSNGGLATNYQLPSLASASAGVNTASITQKQLSWSIRKVYDQTANIEVEDISFSGVVSGDTTPSIQQSGVVGTTSQIAVGSITDFTDTVGITLNNGSNYTLTGATVSGSVLPKPVLIATASATKNFGEADPAFTYSVMLNSLFSGDSLTGSVGRVAGEGIGTYLINDVTGLTNANYTVVVGNAGTLTIRRPVEVLPPRIQAAVQTMTTPDVRADVVNTQSVSVTLETALAPNTSGPGAVQVSSVSTQAEPMVEPIQLASQDVGPAVVAQENEAQAAQVAAEVAPTAPANTVAETQSSAVTTERVVEESPTQAVAQEVPAPEAAQTTEDGVGNNEGIALPDTEVVTVSVPKSMTTSGTGFSFELPVELKGTLTTGQPRADLLDGNPLPSWIKFIPESASFEVGAVPDSGLPIQIVVSNAMTTALVVVSEQ